MNPTELDAYMIAVTEEEAARREAHATVHEQVLQSEREQARWDLNQDFGLRATLLNLTHITGTIMFSTVWRLALTFAVLSGLGWTLSFDSAGLVQFGCGLVILRGVLSAALALRGLHVRRQRMVKRLRLVEQTLLKERGPASLDRSWDPKLAHGSPSFCREPFVFGDERCSPSYYLPTFRLSRLPLVN